LLKPIYAHADIDQDEAEIILGAGFYENFALINELFFILVLITPAKDNPP
jgi:hypothetical protein